MAQLAHPPSCRSYDWDSRRRCGVVYHGTGGGGWIGCRPHRGASGPRHLRRDHAAAGQTFVLAVACCGARNRRRPSGPQPEEQPHRSVWPTMAGSRSFGIANAAGEGAHLEASGTPALRRARAILGEQPRTAASLTFPAARGDRSLRAHQARRSRRSGRGDDPRFSDASCGATSI